MSDTNDKWNQVLSSLNLALSPAQFSHFNGATATLTKANELIIYPSSAVATEWIKKRLFKALSHAIKSAFGDGIKIAIQENFIDTEAKTDDDEDQPQTNILPKGFTPIVDSLAQELGLVPAAIYGVIWRYCQMNSRTCYAEQKTIASKLNLSRRCVNQNIKTLLAGAYIRCLNEKELGKSKVYIVTNKVSIEVGLTIEAKMNGQV